MYCELRTLTGSKIPRGISVLFFPNGRINICLFFLVLIEFKNDMKLSAPITLERVGLR